MTKEGWEKSPDDYIDNNGTIVFLHDDSWKNDVLWANGVSCHSNSPKNTETHPSVWSESTNILKRWKNAQMKWKQKVYLLDGEMMKKMMTVITTVFMQIIYLHMPNILNNKK